MPVVPMTASKQTQTDQVQNHEELKEKEKGQGIEETAAQKTRAVPRTNVTASSSGSGSGSGSDESKKASPIRIELVAIRCVIGVNSIASNRFGSDWSESSFQEKGWHAPTADYK